MVYEKTTTYKGEGKTLEDFQSRIEKILTSFDFAPKSANIDDSLTIVTFIDESKDKDLQKDNKIAIFEEDGRFFIQLKGNISDTQASKFWQNLKQSLGKKEPVKKSSAKSDKKSEKLSKEDLVAKIITKIEEKGYEIENEEAVEFVENFISEFQRLPLIDEIDSIVSGYVKMLKEEAPDIKEENLDESPEPKKLEKVEIDDQDFSEDFSEDIFSEEESISKGEEIQSKISEFNFLNETEQSYYLDLLKKVGTDVKKAIIDNLEFIETQIKDIELREDKIIELRKDLITLDREEIKNTIDRLKEEHKKQIEKLGWDLHRALENLDFLTQANRKTLSTMAKDLPENRQKDVLERLKEIEKEFDDIEQDGIELRDWEKAQYRTELVKLTKQNRKERLVELTRDKKEEIILNKLHKEIPQLKYEDTEKIIKELLWLSGEEIDQRIQKIKNNMTKKLKKKQELFQKSTAGNTCPDCGWPVSSFSKKCPRCGKKLIDWM